MSLIRCRSLRGIAVLHMFSRWLISLKIQMHFLLDFHYSDYWADPGQQNKPDAWKNLSFDELKEAVHKYTYDVLYRLKSWIVRRIWFRLVMK